MNQQHENVTESGIEPETFPLLEIRSTIGAISEQFSGSHIPALYGFKSVSIFLNNINLAKRYIPNKFGEVWLEIRSYVLSIYADIHDFTEKS